LKLTWQTIDLLLKDPFTTSRETKKVKHNVIFRVAKGSQTGVGEAAPSPFYGQSMDSVLEALNKLKDSELKNLSDPETLLNNRGFMNEGDMAARAAVDIALHDLAAQMADVPLHKYLGLGRNIIAATSFTIGIGPQEVMLEKVKRATEYPVLKIKLGFEGDIKALEAIRKETDKVLRVDVNGGWSLEKAVQNLPVLSSLGVEYLEQPLPRGSLAELRKLKKISPVPIIVDEDAVVPEDIPGLSEAADGINVKLMKCGGIGPALRMIREARNSGLKVMLGCMIESSVGITAAAHLASLADYLDLDGNLLIENDPFIGIRHEKGRIALPPGPGLGIKER
jgi:L-alanine-DL-glutamate epimerase-like enolase superfamily enzyme